MVLVGGCFGSSPLSGGSAGGIDINKTVFAGMSVTQVQSYFTVLQKAYLDLATGNKPVTVSYEGKSVTYSPAEATMLKNIMDQAAAILGYGRQRRALRPIYR